MAHPVPTKAFLQPRPKISQGVILAMNHRGWLQGQLGEVLSVKTQGTGNMVHLRDTMCSMAERCWLEFTDVSEVHVVLFP